MNAAIAQRLVALNREFYQRHAASFSATRSRLQPGVVRTLTGLSEETNGQSRVRGRMLRNAFARSRILDLGCGNGSLAAWLAEAGHQGGYVGVDFSEELLAAARQQAAAHPGYGAQFVQADLSGEWAAKIEGEYEVVCAWAVMHHIPSRELRLRFLRQVGEVLRRGGSARPRGEAARFVHSNWQFMRSPKLAGRVQPWELAHLSEADVDEGDYLLDWRSGGRGLRYVHQFSEGELAELAAAAGFAVGEVFYSDGSTGDLSLYSTWSLV